jgi:AcrR family transcriptional regulator
MRTQRQRVEESTQRLLAAAVDLIAERGYSRTTAKDIGLRAGYSRAMVAERFGDKETLLDSVLEQYYEDRLMVDVAKHASGLDAVLSPLDAFADYARTDPQGFRAMLVLNFEATHEAEVLRERVSSRLERFRERMASAINSGIEDGSIRTDVDARQMAADILASGIGIAYCGLVIPTAEDLATSFEQLRDRLRNSLSPVSSRPSEPRVSPITKAEVEPGPEEAAAAAP